MMVNPLQNIFAKIWRRSSNLEGSLKNPSLSVYLIMSSLCVIVVNETVAKHIHDYNH